MPEAGKVPEPKGIDRDLGLERPYSGNSKGSPADPPLRSGLSAKTCSASVRGTMERIAWFAFS